MKAPPPVASTCTGRSSSRRITRRSQSRNADSPCSSKMVSMAQPAAASIS
jgi:hypothetical protein